MRRFRALALICFLLLAGCGESRDLATFYYPRDQVLYGVEDGVIAAEERDVSGHSRDLTYLLYQYMTGPAQEGLSPAFPAGTAVVSVEQTQSKLTITLSDTLSALSDSDYALGCACLTLTCHSLTGIEQVRVLSGQRSVTIKAGDVLQYDGLTAEPTEEIQ